jgi:tetratricopeptide (TPR) repeat protein
VHWARTVAGRFPDGQLYVNLRGYDPEGDPLAPGVVTGWFLAALGVPGAAIPAGAQERAGLYRSVLADRRVLLVLDNARDAAQVRPLLAGGPGCLAVVTSRSSLAGLAAADGARLVRLGPLEHDEATALLAARLGPDRLAAEPGAAQKLIGACGGLPLALAIVAARAASTPGLPLAAIAGELAAAGTLARAGADLPGDLDALETGDAATSIRTVFSWSYRQLTGGAARMFALLGLHPGPDISLPAAASLAGTPPRLGHQQLAELTAASLLTQPQPGRYALHDLLRAYAAEQAEHTDPPAGRDAAARRAINYYLHHTYQAALQVWPNVTLFLTAPVAVLESVATAQITSRPAAVDWYRAEQQVLPRVLAWAAALRLDSDVLQLRICMEPYDTISDLPATNQAMLAAARRLGDPTFIGGAYYLHGREAAHRGSYQEAAGHYVNALQHATLGGNLHLQALIHLGLAEAADRAGHPSRAVEHGRRAAELARAAGSREAEYLSYLGYFEARAGNTEQGHADCEQAVALLRSADGAAELAKGVAHLGITCQLAGRPAEAIAHLREAIALARQSDRLTQEANSLMWLADALTATGEPHAARDAWQQALSLYRQLAPSHPHADNIRAKLNQAER